MEARKSRGTFSYSKMKDREALTRKYVNLIEKEVLPLIERGLCGMVYTQLNDVDGEINGYLTYDRLFEKMDFAAVQEVHRKVSGIR